MPRPDAAWRPYAMPLAASAVLSLLIWGVTVLVVSQLRASTEAAADATRQNLANTLAEQQASSVRAIDISLVFLREAWKRDPRAFDAAVQEQERMLHKERVIQVAVLDAEGWIVYSRLPATGPINFSDRGYFQALKTRGDDALHISEPVFGRVTGQWALQFARAVRGPRGEFAGVIVVALPPPALENAYRQIDLGPQGIITLARADGQILARSADFESSVKVSVAGLRAVAGAAPSGQFTGRGSVDGVERLFAYRTVGDYGLVIFVGQSRAAVLASHLRQRNYLYGFAAAATVLLVYIGALLGLRRRDRARFRDEQERLSLELHDGCIQAIYAIGMNLHGARERLGAAPAESDAAIAQAEADLNLVIQDLRAFIGDEKPGVLSAAQLRAEAERALPKAGATAYRLALDEAAVEAMSPEQASHVLRIIREAAANVARHSGASEARIDLGLDGEEVRLEVSDNGRGLASGSVNGLGLAHIRARARKLNGTADIASLPSGGTRVCVRFPAPA